MLVKIVVLYNFVFDIFLSFTIEFIFKIHLQSHSLYATQNRHITYFFSRYKYILSYLGLKLLYCVSQEPNLQSLSDEWQKIYPKG